MYKQQTNYLWSLGILWWPHYGKMQVWWNILPSPSWSVAFEQQLQQRVRGPSCWPLNPPPATFWGFYVREIQHNNYFNAVETPILKKSRTFLMIESWLTPLNSRLASVCCSLLPGFPASSWVALSPLIMNDTLQQVHCEIYRKGGKMLGACG